MRRADDRRSASVMINSSIRWSLAGNEVDWIMKASEPRTFSWISTKISMSAKRRTTALASCRSRPLAISFASAGLELPATSLIEPFLADIDVSPRALLDTTLSIRDPQNRRVSTAEVISRTPLGWQPVARRFPAQLRVGAGDFIVNGRYSSAHRCRMHPQGAGRPDRQLLARGRAAPTGQLATRQALH